MVQSRPESLQHEEVPAFLVSFGVKNIPLSSKTKTTAKPLLPPELSYSVFHDCPFCWMPDQRLIQPLRRQAAGYSCIPRLVCVKGTFLSLSGNTPSYPKMTDRESITPKMFERGRKDGESGEGRGTFSIEVFPSLPRLPHTLKITGSIRDPCGRASHPCRWRA